MLSNAVVILDLYNYSCIYVLVYSSLYMITLVSFTRWINIFKNGIEWWHFHMLILYTFCVTNMDMWSIYPAHIPVLYFLPLDACHFFVHWIIVARGQLIHDQIMGDGFQMRIPWE